MAKVNIQPLADRVLVRRLDEEEEQKVGGIIIPDTAKEKPQRGKVLAVGPGALNDKGERVALDVEPNDEIIYSKYGGTDIKLEGTEFLILRESDVLAKVLLNGAKKKKK